MNRKLHYCKHCQTNFYVKIHDKETGDYFLICPQCKWPHYRFFKDGVAIHCDLSKRKAEPINILGVK